MPPLSLSGPLPLAISWIEQADRDVLHWVNCRLDSPALEWLLMHAQSKSVAVPIFLAVLAVCTVLRPRASLRALVTAAGAFGICMGIATLMWNGIGRPRPALVLQPVLQSPEEAATCAAQPDGLVLRKHSSRRPGMPSRHSLTAGAFAASLWGIARWLGLGASIYALLVGVGRVYAGVHWPTDVVVGLAMGTLVSWGLWRAIPPLLGLRGRRHWVEVPAAHPEASADETVEA